MITTIPVEDAGETYDEVEVFTFDSENIATLWVDLVQNIKFPPNTKFHMMNGSDPLRVFQNADKYWEHHPAPR